MKIEKIKFERSGGFAGIRLAAELELDDLPEDQRARLLDLLDDVDLDDLSEKRFHSRPLPDEFTYTITVLAKGKEYQLAGGESALPASLQPLIEFLESAAKRQMRNKRHDD